MKLIDIFASKYVVDTKNNTITYETEIEAAPGVLLHANVSGDRDMIIVNQIHEGGKVVVLTKPFRVPAKRYEAGEKIAVLMVNG